MSDAGGIDGPEESVVDTRLLVYGTWSKSEGMPSSARADKGGVPYDRTEGRRAYTDRIDILRLTVTHDSGCPAYWSYTGPLTLVTLVLAQTR